MKFRIITFSLLMLLLAPTLLAQEPVPLGKADPYRVLFVNQRTEMPPWSLAMFSECRTEFERLSGRPVGMLLKNAKTLGAEEAREQSNEPRIDFMVCRNHFTEPPVHLAAQTGIPLIIPTCDTAWIQNASELPPQVYIATIRLSPARTAKEIRTLCPGTKKLIVIAGAHETDHFFMQRAKEELGSLYQGMAVEYWDSVPLPELKERLPLLPNDHAILFLKMTSDPNGTIYVSRNVVRDVVHYSPVPVFGIADTFVGEGILGGYVLSSSITGKRGGEMLARLAASEALPAITHVEEYGEYQFNWDEIKRWGIRESSLPAEARILGRPDSLVERQPWILRLTLSLTVLLTLIVGTTLLILHNRQYSLKKLLKNEDWVKLSTETAGVAIWEYDLVQNRMARSQNHDQLYGVEPQKIWTSDMFLAAVHPDDRDFVMRTIDQAIAAGGPEGYRFDYRTVWPDQSIHWLSIVGEICARDAEGTALLMRGCLIDITDRKQVEEELRESEERYRRAQTISHVGSWEYDLKTTKFLASNETRCIFGFDPDGPDFSTDEVENCIPERERIHQALVDLIEKDRPYNLEYEIHPRDGADPRVIASIAELKRDEHGAPQKVVGVVQDITERKQAEEALIESKKHAQLMADLVANSNQPIAVGFADGRLGRLNPAFCELVGYTEKELQAIDWAVDLTPPEWLPAEREALAELERTGEPVRYEKEYIRKDGTRVPIELFAHLNRDQDGEPEYYFAFITDITERKRTKERDQRKQYHLENAQILGKIGSWDLDVAKNALTWTDETYRIFGLPIGSPLTYKIFLDRIHPDDRELVDQKWTAAMRGEDAYDIEHRLLMDDGEVKWVREKSDLVFDEAGNCLRGSGFTQDITDQKLAAEALRESKAKTRRKLKAITEPESDLSDLELSDLIDVDEIRSLMEDFYEVTGILSAIVDLQGNVLFGVGWQDICTQFHRVHPETAQHCFESDTILSQGGSGNFKAYRCKNNMWDMASPIEIAGQHVGNIFFGQFFYDDEKVDADAFRKQAHQYGFDEEKYLDALNRVPRFNRETVNKAMSFYAKLAGILSKQSYSNIQLSRTLAESKRTEEALRESEERLREAQRTAQIAHWNFDPETGNTEWSEQMYDILGLDPANGPPNLAEHQTFIHPDDWKRFENTVQDTVEHGTPYDIILRIQRPDGREGFINVIGNPVTDEAGTVIELRGTIQDITERKRAEEAVLIRERQYRNVIQTTSDGFWRIDRNLRLIEVNAAYCNMSGYSEQELLTLAITDLDATETPADSHAHAVAVFEAGTGCFETRHRRKDGSEVDVEIITESDPDNEQFFVFIRDITDRKQAEGKILQLLAEANESRRTLLSVVEDQQQAAEALRESQDRYQTLFREMLNGFALHEIICDEAGNPCNYRFLALNPAFERMTGLKAAETVGRTILDIMPDTEQRWIEHYGKVALTGEPVFFENYAAGLKKHFEVVAFRPAMNQFACVFSDITERKEAEEKIRKLNEELEQRVIARTEQLEAANKELKAFSYSVSHDLRAPLRAVDGYTRMLSEDYGPILDEEGQRICSVISSSAQDMGHLIDDLLAFSRFGRAAINPSNIDMEGMARAIFFELTTPEKRARVEFSLQSLPAVAADPTLMRQVWVNLLSNALKFSANRDRADIEVSALQQDDETIYCVRDNGAGFDMRYANKLFGVFQRLHTTKEFGGTGVGLAIVQRIVVRHGGRVWAEGQVNQGASFYFALKGETKDGL